MEFLALAFITFLIVIFMNQLFRKMGIEFLNPFTYIFSYIMHPPIKDDGMMSKQDELKLFSRFNDGLVVDGKNKRLSEKESFNHLALISRTGGGKTTSYVLPNIYKLASENCSMVLTDLSGEIYELTSGYLEKQGFKIYVLDPEKIDESIRYNPLIFANNSMDIDLISEILIASAGMRNTKPEDKIWSDGAKNIISIFIKALQETENEHFINLANVRYLLNKFGSIGEELDLFMQRYTNDKTFNEFKAFTQGNPRTIQSFITTASTALNPIGINNNLEKLTSSHSIDFGKFRKEKSVVYIRISGQRQEQYSFLLNLFYSQLFNFMMESLPNKKDFPLYCLLDEFGNMNIPKFSSIITTIRKYKVSISMILQNTNQLADKYSSYEAKTILDGGVASKLIYSGIDLETASELEKMFGIKKTLNRAADGQYQYEKENVMSASEIRTMKDDEALFIYANKKPIKIRIKPYYKDFMLNSFSKIKPHTTNYIHDDTVSYVDLENVEF